MHRGENAAATFATGCQKDEWKVNLIQKPAAVLYMLLWVVGVGPELIAPIMDGHSRWLLQIVRGLWLLITALHQFLVYYDFHELEANGACGPYRGRWLNTRWELLLRWFSWLALLVVGGKVDNVVNVAAANGAVLLFFAQSLWNLGYLWYCKPGTPPRERGKSFAWAAFLAAGFWATVVGEGRGGLVGDDADVLAAAFLITYSGFCYRGFRRRFPEKWFGAR